MQQSSLMNFSEKSICRATSMYRVRIHAAAVLIMTAFLVELMKALAS